MASNEIIDYLAEHNMIVEIVLIASFYNWLSFHISKPLNDAHKMKY